MKRICSVTLSCLLAVTLLIGGARPASAATATNETGWGAVLNEAGTIRRSTAYSTKEMQEVALRAAQEGAVLLKNEGAALPLKSTDTVAIFGASQLYNHDKKSQSYLPGGAGAGAVWGNIKVSPLDKLRDKASGGKFKLYAPISEKYEKNPSGYRPTDADLKAAKQAGVTKAVFIVSRLEGEGGIEEVVLGGTEKKPDSKIAPGEWYLSTKEIQLLQKLDSTFDQVIVVYNTGNLMDTDFVKKGIDGKQVVDAALAAWYGGHMGPQALADLLVGDVNPSGKLVQTAAPIENYPTTANFGKAEYTHYEEDIFVGYRYFETFDTKYEKVNYEFGHGLSYTTFSISNVKYSSNKTHITVQATVKNTGSVAGKEVVQVYFSAPQMGTGSAKLGKPGKELAGFAKTKTLHPGASQTVTVTFPIADMASYDDTGVTGKRSAWVMEAGNYDIYVGNSVKNVSKAGTYKVSSLTVTEQLTQQMTPSDLSKRLLANGKYETLPTGTPYALYTNPGTETQQTTPAAKITYADVKAGKKTVKDLVSQMTIEELASFAASTEKPGSSSNAGVGGSNEVSTKYGIPVAANLDGPAGSNTYMWAFPSATCIASTWNLDVAADVGTVGGKYDDERVAEPFMWQAVGVNIHRNPLAGRNFEYYSEDPLMTGLMAATVTLRAQEQGVGVIMKHLAVNNQETERGNNDSRVSERALREIYLKGFEITVKEANPASIMTSYNRINGVNSWQRTDLLVNVVRDEWKWDGLFMSDWDDVSNHTADMVLARHNMKMGANAAARQYDDVITAYRNGTFKRSVLEENAIYVINSLLMSDTNYSGPNDANSKIESDEIFADGTVGTTAGGNQGGNTTAGGNNSGGNQGGNTDGTTADGSAGTANPSTPDGTPPTNADGTTITTVADGDEPGTNAGTDPADDGSSLWWLWALIAVVVCGGGTATVLLILKRKRP
ncbi:MAG: glycoside hydrolase family 3 C-terminal domain-containing protein [Clostridia bacterium]|nr:glycoside hydrolase family 3 C-terminal domain-containing protein [Clostridia bacterium]